MDKKPTKRKIESFCCHYHIWMFLLQGILKWVQGHGTDTNEGCSKLLAVGIETFRRRRAVAWWQSEIASAPNLHGSNAGGVADEWIHGRQALFFLFLCQVEEDEDDDMPIGTSMRRSFSDSHLDKLKEAWTGGGCFQGFVWKHLETWLLPQKRVNCLTHCDMSLFLKKRSLSLEGSPWNEAPSHLEKILRRRFVCMIRKSHPSLQAMEEDSEI